MLRSCLNVSRSVFNYAISFQVLGEKKAKEKQVKEGLEALDGLDKQTLSYLDALLTQGEMLKTNPKRLTRGEMSRPWLFYLRDPWYNSYFNNNLVIVDVGIVSPMLYMCISVFRKNKFDPPFTLNILIAKNLLPKLAILLIMVIKIGSSKMISSLNDSYMSIYRQLRSFSNVCTTSQFRFTCAVSLMSHISFYYHLCINTWRTVCYKTS
jgi:hypothetical protein